MLDEMTETVVPQSGNNFQLGDVMALFNCLTSLRCLLSTSIQPGAALMREDPSAVRTGEFRELSLGSEASDGLD